LEGDLGVGAPEVERLGHGRRASVDGLAAQKAGGARAVRQPQVYEERGGGKGEKGGVRHGREPLAGAVFDERAGAGDRSGQELVAGAVVVEQAVVVDGAAVGGRRAAQAALARDLQLAAGVDPDVAGEGVGAGQAQAARVVQAELAEAVRADGEGARDGVGGPALVEVIAQHIHADRIVVFGVQDAALDVGAVLCQLQLHALGVVTVEGLHLDRGERAVVLEKEGPCGVHAARDRGAGERGVDLADAGQRRAGDERGRRRGHKRIRGERGGQQRGLVDAVPVGRGAFGERRVRAAGIEIEAEVAAREVLGVDGAPGDIAAGLDQLHLDAFGVAVVDDLELERGGLAAADEVVGVGGLARHPGPAQDAAGVNVVGQHRIREERRGRGGEKVGGRQPGRGDQMDAARAGQGRCQRVGGVLDGDRRQRSSGRERAAGDRDRPGGGAEAQRAEGLGRAVDGEGAGREPVLAGAEHKVIGVGSVGHRRHGQARRVPAPEGIDAPRAAGRAETLRRAVGVPIVRGGGRRADHAQAHPPDTRRHRHTVFHLSLR